MVEIETQADLEKAIKNPKVFVLFYTTWFEPACQVLECISSFQDDFPSIQFYTSNADKAVELRHNFKSVPAVLMFRDGLLALKREGVDFKALLTSLQRFADDIPVSEPTTEEPDVNQRITQLINSATVMMFMKGSKEQPYCKFSKLAVALLNNMNAEYSTFDILTDEAIRAGIKIFSDFPTFPQLYVKGELLGGVDIMQEMEKDGTLKQQLKEANALQLS